LIEALELGCLQRDLALTFPPNRPPDMGAWWYVRPRLHAAIRFHLRREAWQARAAAAAAAATDAGVWGYGEEGSDPSVARLGPARPEVVVRYVGRPPAASPATASFRCAPLPPRPLVARRPRVVAVPAVLCLLV
jgi:hypothetical protein